MLTFLPKTLWLCITCLNEYLLPGATQSLNASPSGTLEGIMKQISWPNEGQSNHPTCKKQNDNA